MRGTRFHVVVGYREGDVSRVRPFRFVLDMFAAVGWPPTLGSVPEGVPFNVGHAKNAGVRALPPEPNDGLNLPDVLILADADCLAPLAQIREAAWLAKQAPGIVSVANEIRILDRDSTDSLGSWEDALVSEGGELRPADATPQLLAIRRDSFDALGGYDESYTGYGFEDYDFRDRAEERWPTRQVAGLIVHLYHDPDPDKDPGSPVLAANEARWRGGPVQ